MNRVVYDYVLPGGDLFIDTSFENWGVYDVKKATIRATVYELGISRKLGPFTGPEVKKGMTKTVPLQIPELAPPGVYTLKAEYVGYKSVLIKDVRVSVNRTTWIKFELEPAIVPLNEKDDSKKSGIPAKN